MGRPNPSCETRFSGTNGTGIVFADQLTTSRIVNHTRLIHSLLKVLTTRTYNWYQTDIRTRTGINNTSRCVKTDGRMGYTRIACDLVLNSSSLELY